MTAVDIITDKPIVAKRVASRFKINKTKVNYFLDLVLTLLFIVEMEEHFTGIALHEALGLVFAAVFTVHILLHLDWVVRLTRTLFKKVIHESRLNYVLNWLLFVDMILVTISGILISRTLGLDIALDDSLHKTLREIHLIGSEFVLILVALHVAMHWKWIKTHSTKYVLGWLSKRNAKQTEA